MSLKVKSAELNPDCEGCQAAQRALDGYKHVVIKAMDKIRGLMARIKKLEDGLRETKFTTGDHENE